MTDGDTLRNRLLGHLRQYTDMPDEALLEVVEQIPVQSFPKGEVLLAQGNVPSKCYFVFCGLIRQYFIDADGREHTVNFFEENQTAAVFASAQKSAGPSPYSFVCAEDSALLVGDLNGEEQMYAKYPFLEKVLKAMLEEMMGQSQEEYAQALSAGPEERYRALLVKRPGLLRRVPQYQLASYLGIQPESLSRIRRRLHAPDEEPQRE